MESLQVPDLASILDELEKNTKEETLEAALVLIDKLLKNITTNPHEEKFRSIKIENQTLKNKVFNVAGIDKVFLALNFQLIDLNYIYLDNEILILENGRIQITKILEKFALKRLPDEEKKKQMEIQEEQEEMRRKFKKEKEEMEKLRNLSKLDRKEKGKEIVKESIGKKVEYGAKVKTCKDMGIGEKKGGG